MGVMKVNKPDDLFYELVQSSVHEFEDIFFQKTTLFIFFKKKLN